MVGVGNLGQALLGYRGFGSQNFSIAAAFDADPAKVGQVVQGLTIQPVDELAATVRAKDIRLGMIVVPAGRAQEVADRLVAAGVEGIVNFAPVTLVLPRDRARAALVRRHAQAREAADRATGRLTRATLSRAPAGGTAVPRWRPTS